METGEYKSKVGLDSLYVAEVTQDDAADYVADTPEWLAPAAEASQEPSSSLETQYADNQAYDVLQSEGETKGTLTVTGLPVEMLAKICGRIFDVTTGRMYDHGGVAPYYALSFRSLKSNGSYRYYQFLKVKFSMPKEEMATKGEKPEPKTLQVEFTAIKTIHPFVLSEGVTESVKRVVGDEDTVDFDGDTWFDQVQVPAIVAPAALSLVSSVPADAEGAASKTANFTLTFNNRIDEDSLSGLQCILAQDGTVKALTAVTIDSTKLIITATHTALTGAKLYFLALKGLKDVYGQTLDDTVAFTTVA
jgi:phi13 family phage major tail protein